MAGSVKQKFFSGVFWTFIQNIGVKVVGLFFSILLTRLLNPSDYGLIGMLSIFIAISEVFIVSGFGEALVQKKDCTDEDFSTALYFNIGIAVLIYSILFLAAPLIADFYHEPKLILLTRVLSLNFVFGSFNIVQQSKLTKEMNFKPLAIITLVCIFMSGAIGVAMAYLGFGVWALVTQTLASTILRVVLFPFFTHWHPNRPFSIDSFRFLWQYGSRLLVTGVIGVIVRNFSNILIGRYYDKDQVGFYSRSQSLAEVPSVTLFSVLSTVTFPALCEVQEDRDRWIAVYKRVLFNTVLIVSPIILLLVLLSRPLVIILFTERWAPCIPLLQALLLARMFLPAGATHTSLLRSAGDTTLYMKLYFITGPISLFAVAVSIPFGVVAMAWATFIGSLVSYLIPAYVVGRKFGYSLWRQLIDWRWIFLSLALMCIMVYATTFISSNNWIQLIVGVFVGGVVYYLCCKVFKMVDDELVLMIKNKLHLKQ